MHNFFPLLSPAVHEVLHARGIPVVQTLHNYRLFCAAGTFLREGRACEDCVAAGPWNAVRHACYRGERLATAVWAEATLEPGEGGRAPGHFEPCFMAICHGPGALGTSVAQVLPYRCDGAVLLRQAPVTGDNLRNYWWH